MLELSRRYGPTLLVPAAWLTTTLAIYTTILPGNALLIAHLVMAAFMAVFLLTGWREMDSGVLKAWRNVIAIGLPFTLAGAASLSGFDVIPVSTSLIAWMLLPGIALLYTGREMREGTLYTVSGLLSLLGLYLYLVRGLFAQPILFLGTALALVCIGQSIGIWAAAYLSPGRG